MHSRNVVHSELTPERAFPHSEKPPEGWAPVLGRKAGSAILGCDLLFAWYHVRSASQACRPAIDKQTSRNAAHTYRILRAA